MELWRDFERSFVRLVARGAGKVVARAATKDGARKPLSWVQDEFFLGISDELEELGVSRRVASGMFGVSRRTYIRKLQGAESGASSSGESLWWSILQVLRAQPMAREDLLAKFSHRPPELVGSILFDMMETKLVADDSGVLTAAAAEDEWTDQRLLNLLNMLEGEGTLPPIAELATTVGVEASRVERLVDESRVKFSVKNAHHETLFGLLGLFVEHAYLTAYRELHGESTDAFVYRLAMTPTGEKQIPRLQEIVSSACDSVRIGLDEVLTEHGTRSEAGKTIFTTVVSHITHRPGWIEG